MPKPRKKRNVLYPPLIVYFKPQGIPLRALDEVVLTVDEYEAVRLSDYEGLKQEEAAKKMNISRPTFTRIVESARRKISDALVNGKALRIEGGSFVFLGKRVRCRGCGSIWEIGREDKESGRLKLYVSPGTESDLSKTSDNPDNIESLQSGLACPNCRSRDIEDIGLMFFRGRRRRGGGF